MAGLVFLVIPTVAFVLLGGVRWLKRVLGLGRGDKGSYSRVNGDIEM